MNRTASIQPAHTFGSQMDKILANQILHSQINTIIFDQSEQVVILLDKLIFPDEAIVTRGLS